MMGLWPRRAAIGLAYRDDFTTMDERVFRESDDEFHPPYEHHGQHHHPVILPSYSQASTLTQTLSFSAGDFGEAHTPSVFAESNQHHDDDKDDRKPPPRRTVFGSSNFFLTSHGDDSPDVEATLAAAMPPETGDFHQHSLYTDAAYQGFGAYAPPPPHEYLHLPPAMDAMLTDSEAYMERGHASSTTMRGGWTAEHVSVARRSSKAVSKEAQRQSKTTAQKKMARPTKHVKTKVNRKLDSNPAFQESAAIFRQPAMPRSLFQDEAFEGNNRESVKFQPTEEEIAECKNNRKLKALDNFYARLNDLADFKLQNGHCNVPQQYDENKQLGVWVNKTRMEKKKFDKGSESSLSQRRIELLDRLEFNWGTNKGDAKWEEHFKALKLYHTKNNHCNVPTKYDESPALGRFVSTQRCEYKKFQRGDSCLIDQDKINRLEKLGFCWDMLGNT